MVVVGGVDGVTVVGVVVTGPTCVVGVVGDVVGVADGPFGEPGVTDAPGAGTTPGLGAPPGFCPTGEFGPLGFNPFFPADEAPPFVAVCWSGTGRATCSLPAPSRGDAAERVGSRPRSARCTAGSDADPPNPMATSTT